MRKNQPSTQNSRLSGDILEFYTAQTIILNKGKIADDFTREKLAKLEAKVDAAGDITIGNRVSFIRKLSRFFRNFTIREFQFTKDSDGKAGDTADIKLTTTDGVVSLSLKRNNTSVKAQRPQGLHAQLTPEAAAKYRTNYSRMNNFFSRKFSKYSKFDEIPPCDKSIMYSYFNRLYAETINKYQPGEQLVNFLLSNNIDSGAGKYMLEWNDRNNSLRVYDCKKLQIPNSLWAQVKPDAPSYLTLEFFDDDANPYLGLELRLHNASKELTPTLSIKYDTKITNIGVIYPCKQY